MRRRTWLCAAKIPGSASIQCVRCSTDCATWPRPGATGACSPNDLPRRTVVYQQIRRWIEVRSFETMVEDLRISLREYAGRRGQPTAVVLDIRILQLTAESVAGGLRRAKRRKGSKVHAVVDTLRQSAGAACNGADEQDRAQIETLAETVQEITGERVELAYVDQGYAGENAARAAEKHGIQLEVVKHTEAKRGLVPLPRRWVVERSVAWAVRFHRLARDCERLASTLLARHYLAFAILMLANRAKTFAQSQ